MKTELYTDQIDIDPSEAALAAIDQALDTIEANATFLRSLSAERRMVLRGLSFNTEGFANLALDIALDNEVLLPRGLDLAQIQRDKSARARLKPRLERLRKITAAFDSTVLLLGSDYYNGALAIYASLKRFGQQSGIRVLIQELAQQFKRRKTAQPESEAVEG